MVSRAPLCPIGSLVTCTSTLSPGGQRLLDAPGLAAEPGGVPVDLARVEHGVAAPADVDERRLHRRQHVLHPAEVDVADQRAAVAAGDEVLDEDVVLQHADLDPAAALAHHHRALDGLAPGQELGLGEDRRTAAARVAPVAAALALGLQPGGAADALHAVAIAAVPAVTARLARGADAGDGAGRVVVGGIGRVVAGTAAATATTAPTAALGGLGVGLVGLLGVVVRLVVGVGLGVVVVLVGLVAAPAPTAAPTAPTPTAAGAVIAVVRPVVEVVGGVRVGGLLGGDVGGHLGGGVLGCGGLLDGLAAATAPPRRRSLARCLLDGGLGPRGRLEQGRGGRENRGERADSKARTEARREGRTCIAGTPHTSVIAGDLAAARRASRRRPPRRCRSASPGCASAVSARVSRRQASKSAGLAAVLAGRTNET